MVAAIYNVYDGLELLPYSVKNIEPLVEAIVFVYQDKSNYGEFQNTGEDIYDIVSTVKCPVAIISYTPDMSQPAVENERRKREAGLRAAERMGCTHFLDIDCDEFYIKHEFLAEKQRVLSSNLNGLVCRSKVYFGSPTLTIGTDVTLVPILQKVQGAVHGINKNYPFAWTDMDGVPFTPKKRIRIDPTRQLSFTSGVEWSEIFMHHFSYVRSDLKLKIRNSSARFNIEKSTVLNDYKNADVGYFCQFYEKTLMKCDNVFGLPEIIDLTI